MAIDVKIPTILRTYTGGEKTVQADGPTLSALIDDLDAKHTGLKGRLITDDGGTAPLRQRLRQRRGRPVHRLAGHRAQGRRRGDDPARRRRRMR